MCGHGKCNGITGDCECDAGYAGLACGLQVKDLQRVYCHGPALIRGVVLPEEVKKFGDFCGRTPVRQPSISEGECVVERGCPPSPDGKTMYCLDVAKQSSPRAIFGCRSCLPDTPNAECSCLSGEYCVKDKSNGKQGTCQAFEGSIVGKTCSTDAAAGSDDFCGKVNSYETAKGAIVNVTEWIGPCDNHVCGAPLSKRAKLCGKGSTDYLSKAPQTTAKHDKLQLPTPEIPVSLGSAVAKQTEQPTKGGPTLAGDQAKGMMGSGKPTSNTPPSIDKTTSARRLI